MPAIFNAQKVESIYNDFQTGHFSRTDLAIKYHMANTPELVDQYLLAGLKKFTDPALAYKQKKETEKVKLRKPSMQLKLHADSTIKVKGFQRPPATYSNQQSTYGERNYKSLLDKVKA